MNKSNYNKLIKVVLGLGTLAVLALGVMLTPSSAKAQYSYGTNIQYSGGGYVPQTTYPYNTNPYYTQPNPYPQPTYPTYPPAQTYPPYYGTTYTQPAPVNYYPPVYTAPAPVRTITHTIIKEVPVPAPAATNNTTTYDYSSLPAATPVQVAPQQPQTNQNGYSTLASNAVFGSSGSFYPSGIVQWILFAILILLIVILVRRIFGGTAHYNNEPLKHS